MTQTPRHGFPLLVAGQAQKEVTHNEALLAIDGRLHCAVETRTLAVPPASPAAGAMYIVAAGAGDAWADKVDMIASWDGFAWRFTPPAVGWLAWIIDEAVFAAYDGSWSASLPCDGLRIAGRAVLGSPLEAVAAASGGAVVDAECRAMVQTLLLALRNQGIVL